MGNHLERVVGVLNGVLGDYLKRTSNGLATTMQLVRDGHPVPLARAFPAAVSAQAMPRIVVLVHGLMSTEEVWTMPDGETYGSLLARDLGYTPLYVRYNSGLRVSENGEALDVLLEQLVCAYPVAVEELALIGHSMGGLVARSAAHAASDKDRRWLPLVKRAFYLGTPHLGAPLERFGNVVTWALASIDNPYTKLIADIVDLRSGGMKDLAYANLRREDWEGASANALLQNRRHPVPLLPHIRHHLIAGALTADPRLSLLFGDAMVSLRSATGRAVVEDRCSPFPQEHARIMPSLGHLRLAHDPDVYAQIRAWCEEAV
ncbi:esterase/lipase family protein [Sorangium sp. So ce363]|uniref:esterase/lipase family protein n=1 Tax=Sorangium sp. So ce363 TaxID=3133304 RepID=UPI003F5E372F